MRKNKAEILNLKILTSKQEKKNKKLVDKRWIVKIIFISFMLSFILSTVSETILPNTPLLIEIALILIFILLGVVFDMIGVAVTASSLEPFNSMAARKVSGAKLSVKLIKNADKVSSFCNDVIGDICGVISGGAGTILSLNIANTFSFNIFLTTLIITSLIASMTIGCKALGKSYAVNKSNLILFRFAKFLSLFIKGN